MNRFFALLLLPLLLPACAPAGPDVSERPLIVVSLPVAAHLVEPLIGPQADVRVLLPNGASPHGFEPRPSDAILLSRASGRIALHPDIDGWFARMTSDPVQFVFQEPSAAAQDLDHAHDHSEDAHVWMDPVHFAEGIPVVADLLCETFPADCPDIRHRSDSLRAVWSELDAWTAALFSNQLEQPPVVLALPFLIPFLDRYRIPYLGPLQPVPGQMHAPSTLDAVATAARTNRAEGLVSQTILNDSGMKQFAADNGLTLVPLEPVGSGHAHYDLYIRYLAANIHAARR